ncbi:hypothetical protein [Thermotalea metallivorans]|uniref:Cell division protein FtsL n=1 Tax=Thermotalea metallivorans TaxID=520762 RepID=A0A140L5U9_9FIRM|nr:hypothetical protein [Thermotalea metallivorans]KXG75924.1 hypothetical protein AN619_13870 [Thermotalea metallivorans]
MIVSQRKYDYRELENTQKEQRKKDRSAAQRRHKIKAVHKLQIMLSIVAMAGLCVAILLGYVALTEAKYRVHALDKEIKQLEGQIENLKVKTEIIKKSTVIEERAMAELGMQYPTKEQMVFLDIDNHPKMGGQDTKENGEAEDNGKNGKLMAGVKAAVEKIYSLLD